MKLKISNRKVYSASIESAAACFWKADIEQILAYMSNCKVFWRRFQGAMKTCNEGCYIG